MLTIKDQLAEFNRLDAARTQGEWSHEPHDGDFGFVRSVVILDEEEESKEWIAEDVRKGDADFICAAPAILRLANDQTKLLDELLEALDYLLQQTVDQDLKHGITLTEGEEDARQKALAVIARAAA